MVRLVDAEHPDRPLMLVVSVTVYVPAALNENVGEVVVEVLPEAKLHPPAGETDHDELYTCVLHTDGVTAVVLVAAAVEVDGRQIVVGRLNCGVGGGTTQTGTEIVSMLQRLAIHSFTLYVPG